MFLHALALQYTQANTRNCPRTVLTLSDTPTDTFAEKGEKGEPGEVLGGVSHCNHFDAVVFFLYRTCISGFNCVVELLNSGISSPSRFLMIAFFLLWAWLEQHVK